MTHSKRSVLDVGQCGFDHGNISRVLQQNFDVTIDKAESTRQALERMAETPYDLVLVNRQLDADGTEGLDLIRSAKADESTKTTPVMLVSNFADAQEAAVKAGAEPGFGKAALAEPDTLHRLAQYLGPEATTARPD